MIQKFLKAKHWQIFILTFGLPFLIQIIVMPIALTGNDPSIIMNVFPIIMILFIGGMLGWLWSVGIGLQDKIPDDLKMKTGAFKTFIIFPVVYLLLILIFMSSVAGGAMENGTEPNDTLIGSMAAVIIPLHLFAMFCMFYSLYFVAKTFKTVELQREVTFSDYAGEFFMIWFFPIGIWIIQPKINKMVEENG